MHSLQSRGLWLSRASSMPDLYLLAKQYSAVFEVFCITCTEDNTTHLSAVQPFLCPQTRQSAGGRVCFLHGGAVRVKMQDRAFSYKRFSSLITFYLLCSFLLLQNSYRAAYFPCAAEFIWAISFLVFTLLFLLLLEVERPKCREKNYSHNISSITKTKIYLYFRKFLPF